MQLDFYKQATSLAQNIKDAGFYKIRISINSEQCETCSVRNQETVYHGCLENSICFVEAMCSERYTCTYCGMDESVEEIVRRLHLAQGLFDKSSIEEIEETKDYGNFQCHMLDTTGLQCLLSKIEEMIRSYDNIFDVTMCQVRRNVQKIFIVDDNGKYLSDVSECDIFEVRIVAKDGQDTAVAEKWCIIEADSIDSDMEHQIVTFAREIAEHVQTSLHSEGITSGIYPVILENRVMAEFMGTFLPVFYAENIHYGKSRLKERCGEQIAVDNLDFVEDPEWKSGMVRRSIDDEGEPVRKKYLIRNGKQAAVLYNKKSASEKNTVSTGNGFKAELTGSVETGATNLILSGKERTTLPQMIASVKDGIFIRHIEGMFAGADAESGDFSLLAAGNRIRNGEVKEAVTQFTISGNIYELWKEIEMIGDDKGYYALEAGCVISPSVKVKKLIVAGE